MCKTLCIHMNISVTFTPLDISPLKPKALIHWLPTTNQPQDVLWSQRLLQTHRCDAVYYLKLSTERMNHCSLMDGVR